MIQSVFSQYQHKLCRVQNKYDYTNQGMKENKIYIRSEKLGRNAQINAISVFT